MSMQTKYVTISQHANFELPSIEASNNLLFRTSAVKNTKNIKKPHKKQKTTKKCKLNDLVP